MNINRPILVCGLCFAGFLFGFAGNRVFENLVLEPADPRVDRNEKSVRSTENAANRNPAPPSRISTLRSADTLETIIGIQDDSLYPKLALWLIDASEPEIAAFWQAYKQRPDRTNEITELLFIHWTRLDPQAAIAASAGTEEEQQAWRAWAVHDPSAALRAAIHQDHLIASVVRGIGEFQGDWLREHFDEIPEDCKEVALTAMSRGHDSDQAEAMLDFFKEHGHPFNERLFNKLIQQDPWAAIDWMQNHQDVVIEEYGSHEKAMKHLAQTMAELHPDALQRLADQTPNGEAKRNMEAALFENLLKNDPDAARVQAEATKAPLIAAERLAAVGLSLVKTDPDAALEAAEKLFTILPNALGSTTFISYPEGMSWSGSPLKDAEELVGRLIDEMPDRLLESISPSTRGLMGTSKPFSELATRWAKNDIAAYADWLNRQTDPDVRNPAVEVMVDQLSKRDHFQEAAEWAIGSPMMQSSLKGMLHQWHQSQPGGPENWLKTANIPATEKDQFHKMIRSFESH
jgi:hypothetical protein